MKGGGGIGWGSLGRKSPTNIASTKAITSKTGEKFLTEKPTRSNFIYIFINLHQSKIIFFLSSYV